MRREGVDRNQIEFVYLDRVLAINPCVAGPERHLAGARVDQPAMLIVGLKRKKTAEDATASPDLEHEPIEEEVAD